MTRRLLHCTAQSRLLPAMEAGAMTRDLPQRRRSTCRATIAAGLRKASRQTPHKGTEAEAAAPETEFASRQENAVLFCCFLSGWADTVAVIHFLTFAAMMTGKLIFVGIKMARKISSS
ncbi:hypothetical protein FVE85_8071 [Porphyridium purpureum]|uniref:Uncharacterized protein n=1 Tax=Porphyridium purpureum TaxID=35688 RepID=A0A5J4YPE8_PORPP|nr:hypothetical protein FVE85_8071 [Porphyridium purpureum]|eukprot:POR9425..scf295_9